MTKLSFLFSLREMLSVLPPEDVEERLRFYSEMIEDRMEEGLSEEEAVAAVGTAEDIAAQILSDTGLPPKIPSPKSKMQHSPRGILLLVLGSPVWLSLLIAMFAVAFALFVSMWSVIVSFWAVFAAFVGGGAGLAVSGTLVTSNGNIPTGLALIAVGLILGGLAIFLFYGCKAATKGTVWLTGKTVRFFRSIFRKKEAVSCK